MGMPSLLMLLAAALSKIPNSLTPSPVTPSDDKILAPSVTTSFGTVVGYVETFKDGKLNVFAGIPYAQPPVGKRRFKRPEPLTIQDKLIKATRIPNLCYQPRLTVNQASSKSKMSEDCLYLTIIQRADALKSKSKKAVLVNFGVFFIDFLTNARDQPVLLSYPLILRQDIIVVIVNFRTNFFGYGYSKEKPELEGNLGLWDQNMAMRWVKNNIEFFNGDPDAITISGDGSSATEVAFHIISPQAEGLFRSALMTRDALFAIGEDSNARTSESSSIVIKRLGCWWTKDVISCLQKVPPKKIIDALPKRFSPLRPVFETEYAPTSPQDAVTNSHFNEANLLIGFDKDAGSTYVSVATPQVWADTRFKYKQAVGVISQIFNKDYSRIIAKKYIQNKKNQMDVRHGVRDLVTDILFACPVFDFAQRVASRQKESITLAFIIDYIVKTPLFLVCQLDPRLGVCDRTSTLLATGRPLNQKFYHSYSDEDRRISVEVMTTLGTYIKLGGTVPGLDTEGLPSRNSTETPAFLTLVMSSGPPVVDQSHAEFCLKNYRDFEENVLDKYYPLDPKTKKKQIKLDSKSSFSGFLYKAYYYLPFQLMNFAANKTAKDQVRSALTIPLTDKPCDSSSKGRCRLPIGNRTGYKD